MSRQRKNNQEEIYEDDNSTWIVTYADMITVMLVFFILLYSMSNIELEKFRTAFASIQTSLNSGQINVSRGGAGDSDKELADTILEISDAVKDSTPIRLEEVTGLREPEERIVRDVEKMITFNGLNDSIKVFSKEGKVIIQIRGTALFESGAAELNDDVIPVFDEIYELFFKYPDYSISIKGHTDDVPISTDRFASNWELSAVRAATVLRYFIDRDIDPYRMTATGYGDLMPLVPNDSPANRSINRRVEFVLEKEKDQ